MNFLKVAQNRGLRVFCQKCHGILHFYYMTFLFLYPFSLLSLRESLAQIIEAGKRVIDDPTHLADFGAALTSGESHQIQAVLDCPDVITLSSLWQNYGHCLVKNWKKCVDSFNFDCIKYIENLLKNQIEKSMLTYITHYNTFPSVSPLRSQLL